MVKLGMYATVYQLDMSATDLPWSKDTGCDAALCSVISGNRSMRAASTPKEAGCSKPGKGTGQVSISERRRRRTIKVADIVLNKVDPDTMRKEQSIQ